MTYENMLLVKEALTIARDRIFNEDYQGTCSRPCRRNCSCYNEHKEILDKIEIALTRIK